MRETMHELSRCELPTYELSECERLECELSECELSVVLDEQWSFIEFQATLNDEQL